MLARIMPRLDPPAPVPAPDQRILAAIRALPHGQVASYGTIARRAGVPGRARLVARLLARNEEKGLPWKRVVREDGRMDLSKD